MANSQYIHYNIIIPPDPDDPEKLVPARFTTTRVQPILHNPRDYSLAIERFKIPSYQIPLFFFKENTQYITLSFDGYSATQPIVYITANNADEYKRPTIWNVGQFVEMVNNALKLAYDDLKINKPAITATAPPLIKVEKQQFSIISEDPQYTYSPTLPIIKLYMNPNLYYYFTGFDCIENENTPNDYERHQILLRDYLTNKLIINGNNYIETKEQYESIKTWSILANIAFETSAIPVVSELLPTQNNSVRYIITDFEILEELPSATSYQYFPRGPLRYYSLQSNFPLYTLDLRVVWISTSGEVFDYYISGNIPLSMKILFEKRQELKFEDVQKEKELEYRKESIFGKS